MAVWALSVLQFSLTIALPEDSLKQEEEEEEEEENEELFEEKSYFRNKVAPMSYMHYKAMMREGFDTTNNSAQISRRSPTAAQIAFQKKYENTSKTLSTLRYNVGTLDKKINNDSAETTRKAKISTSSQISNRTTTSSDSSRVISLPSGERIARNIGSPASIRSNRIDGRNNISSESNRNNRHIGSPQSNRSNKRIGSPLSQRTARSHRLSQSLMTRQSKLSNSNVPEMRKRSAWHRFADSVKTSKQRKKEIPLQRKDSIKEDNSLGIGKKEVQNCFLKYLELIGILIPVCMQDGPFFIFRFVLVAHYQVVTEMIILLTTKNALVVIVQVYRILLMYCSEPKQEEPDIEDASVRVRTAMYSNKKLSTKDKTKRASIAIQAISRMNYFQDRHNETDLINGKIDEHVVIQM